MRVTIAHHSALKQIYGYNLAHHLRKLIDWPRVGVRKVTQTDKDVKFMTLYGYANEANALWIDKGTG